MASSLNACKLFKLLLLSIVASRRPCTGLWMISSGDAIDLRDEDAACWSSSASTARHLKADMEAVVAAICSCKKLELISPC